MNNTKVNKSTVSIIPAGSEGRSIHFDIVKSLGLSRQKVLTKAPVSKGVPISDNITKYGDVITLECKVTNTPLVDYNGNLINSNTVDGRIHSAYNVLKNLDDNDIICTLVHKFETHTDMVLVDRTPVILPSNTVGFSLKFEKVRYAGEQRIDLVTNMSPAKAANSQAAEQKKGGKFVVEDGNDLISDDILREWGILDPLEEVSK